MSQVFVCIIHKFSAPNQQVILAWRWYKGSLIKQSPFSLRGAEYLPLSPLPPLSQVEMETFHSQKVDYTQENTASGQTLLK